MTTMNKIAVVIPAHNEERSLPYVLESINSISVINSEMEVFLVDDGSMDNTYVLAHEYGAEVVRHPVCMGVGGALKTGYLLAMEWGADIIVQLDADGEHDPVEISSFVNSIRDDNVDMIVGSRFIDHSPPLSFVRRIGIGFFTWLVNKMTGYSLTDVTSGYRAFKVEVLDKIMFLSDTHWAIEMTLLCGRHGVKVKEIPIVPSMRNFGKSQFHELMTFVLYPIIVIKQIIDVYF